MRCRSVLGAVSWSDSEGPFEGEGGEGGGVEVGGGEDAGGGVAELDIACEGEAGAGADAPVWAEATFDAEGGAPEGEVDLAGGVGGVADFPCAACGVGDEAEGPVGDGFPADGDDGRGGLHESVGGWVPDEADGWEDGGFAEAP